jgi:hypothetical protein
MTLIKYAIYLSLLAMSQSVSQSAPEPGSYLKQAAISEAGGAIHIVADSPRPLVQTLDALQQKYGWVVDYEDPQFISELDLVKTGDSGNRAPNSKLSARLPAGGSFTVEFPANAPDEEKILQLVVDSYNQSDNPGRFELRSGKSGTFVVGAEARDARGQISHQRAVFDVPITLAERQRTASDTVNLICRKISAQRGIPVTVGVSPRRLLDHISVTVGGTKVSARDLLIQTLTSTHHRLYWRLLFDPNSKGYFLNIHSSRVSS